MGVLLAALAVVVSVAPAPAHTVSSVVAPAEPTPSALSTPPPPPVESVAMDSPVVPLWAVVGALLLAFTVAPRRPRRRLVVALVLLLTVFAFENALHSVHHGFDAAQYDECTIAAVSAQLSAVSVDGVAETSVILAGAGPTTEPDLSPRSPRSLGPDRGRAPPLPTA